MKFFHSIFLAGLVLLPCASHAAELSSFTSDGCSSFPDGTLEQQSLWLDCCIRHDLAYWKGGTYDERLEADRSLERCVYRVGEPGIAQLMLAGVRVGGSPFYPTPFRWGYGWPYLRGYKALTSEEKMLARQKLKELEILLKKIAAEIEGIE